MNSSNIYLEELQEDHFFSELNDEWESDNEEESSIILDAEPETDNPQLSNASQIKFLNTVDQIVGFAPDITYITGMSLNLFSQNIFSENEKFLNLSSTQSRVSIDIWNEIDSVCAIYYGLRLLTDKNNYRRKTCIVQGVLNILTGITMGYLTDNNQIRSGFLIHACSTALASPAFALATACDLLNVSIDLYHTAQELDFKGWLHEKIQELNFIEKRLETAPNLIHKRNELIFQIRSRCLAKHDDHPLLRRYIENKLKENPNLLLNSYYSPEDVRQAKIIDKEIQEEMNARYQQQQKIVLIKTLSFVGMTLLAVATFTICPPLLIVGTAICTLVAAYYLQKNVQNTFCFFKDYRSHSKSQKAIDSSAAAFSPS